MPITKKPNISSDSERKDKENEKDNNIVELKKAIEKSTRKRIRREIIEELIFEAVKNKNSENLVDLKKALINAETALILAIHHGHYDLALQALLLVLIIKDRIRELAS